MIGNWQSFEAWPELQHREHFNTARCALYEISSSPSVIAGQFVDDIKQVAMGNAVGEVVSALATAASGSIKGAKGFDIIAL